MKIYLDKIEQILGAALNPKEISKMEFSDKMLKELVAFSNEYFNQKKALVLPNEGLNCFLSLPDILSDNFKTYKSSGDLEGHWPDDIQLANALLFHDRVLIHDHLHHYAASSLSGYSEGSRYSGLSNWLLALACWRPLIADDRICILPQFLAYSKDIQSIWDDALFEISSKLLCYFDDLACDMIESDFEDEFVTEINEIAYMLAGMSVNEIFTGNQVPFLSQEEKYGLYRNVMNAFLNIASDKYLPGKTPGQSIMPDTMFQQQLQIERAFDPADDMERFCKDMEEGLFADSRKELEDMLKLLKPDNGLEPVDVSGLKLAFQEIAEIWSKRIDKLNGSESERAKQKKIHFNFASVYLQQISAGNRQNERKAEKSVFNTLNNIERTQSSEDRLGHYGFAII